MSRYLRSLISLGCSFFFCFSALAVAQQAEATTSKLEQRLRERCAGLYTAIQNSQWRKVESFFNEDAKIAWAAMKKSAIYGFEIQTAKVSPDGKSGLTATTVDSPMRIPGFPGTKIRAEQTIEWAWENEDWYALLKDLPTEGEKAIPVPGPDGQPPLAEVPPENTLPSELAFTSQVFDFKLIRRGETVQARFYFTNKSDHVVKAQVSIFNPCGCVTAKISKEQFKPGEDGVVETTWDTKDFGGQQRQGLEVHMQPSGAKVLLQMRGYILMPWQNRDQKPTQ